MRMADRDGDSVSVRGVPFPWPTQTGPEYPERPHWLGPCERLLFHGAEARRGADTDDSAGGLPLPPRGCDMSSHRDCPSPLLGESHHRNEPRVPWECHFPRMWLGHPRQNVGRLCLRRARDRRATREPWGSWRCSAPSRDYTGERSAPEPLSPTREAPEGAPNRHRTTRAWITEP